jgi:hypothetical protein
VRRSYPDARIVNPTGRGEFVRPRRSLARPLSRMRRGGAATRRGASALTTVPLILVALQSSTEHDEVGVGPAGSDAARLCLAITARECPSGYRLNVTYLPSKHVYTVMLSLLSQI